MSTYEVNIHYAINCAETDYNLLICKALFLFFAQFLFILFHVECSRNSFDITR